MPRRTEMAAAAHVAPVARPRRSRAIGAPAVAVALSFASLLLAGWATAAPDGPSHVPCPPGSFIEDGSASGGCAVCPPGTYSATWNATSCARCRSGDLCTSGLLFPPRACVPGVQTFCPLGGSTSPTETGWPDLPPLTRNYSSDSRPVAPNYFFATSSSEHAPGTVTASELLLSASFDTGSANRYLIVAYFASAIAFLPLLVFTVRGRRLLHAIDCVYEVPTRDIAVPLNPYAAADGPLAVTVVPVRTQSLARGIFTVLALLGALAAFCYVIQDFLANRYIEERSLVPITTLNMASDPRYKVEDDVLDTYPTPVFVFLLLGTNFAAENTTLSVVATFDDGTESTETVNVDDIGANWFNRTRYPASNDVREPSFNHNSKQTGTMPSTIGDWAAWVTDALDEWDDARPIDPSIQYRERGKGYANVGVVAPKVTRVRPPGMASLRSSQDMDLCRARGRGHCTLIMMKRNYLGDLQELTFGRRVSYTFYVGTEGKAPSVVQAMRFRVITMSWRTGMFEGFKRNALTWIEGGMVMTSHTLVDNVFGDSRLRGAHLAGILYSKALLRGPHFEPLSRGFDLQPIERSEGQRMAGETSTLNSFYDYIVTHPFRAPGAATWPIFRIDLMAPSSVLQIDIHERITMAVFLTSLVSLPAAVVGAGGLVYTVFVMLQKRYPRSFWASLCGRARGRAEISSHRVGMAQPVSSSMVPDVSQADLEAPLLELGAIAKS